MRLLLYRLDGNTAPWASDFRVALPGCDIVEWREGAVPPCDYALVWGAPAELLAQLGGVKAIFVAGAGVDALLKFGDTLPDVPLVRLGDAGMGVQMAEYVLHAVLRYFRRFDDYDSQAREGVWAPLSLPSRQDFTVGVMGIGELGSAVLRAFEPLNFPLRGWSRTPKAIDGVRCFAGPAQLDAFLAGTRVLVCMLPLTAETNNLLDRALLEKLPRGAYLINVARGSLVAEPDLLALIKSGHIAGATLDVFRNEPLPAPHPFWGEPKISITPHISALTVREESVRQVARQIMAHEAGQGLVHVVDRSRGY
ncbi:MAG: 2-hydroxyacid dehydrogenase [Massilia sp.]